MKKQKTKTHDQAQGLASLLPKKVSFREFAEKMQKLPDFLKSDLPKGIDERAACLRQIRMQWFHVTSKHYEVYECFDEVIRSRYEQLDSSSFMATLERVYEWNDNCKNPEFVPKGIFERTVDGFSIIGPSGLGKTLTVNSVLRNFFPKVIKHDHYYQLVHLKVNCSNIGSTKALCYQILDGFDEALGTDYYERHLSNFYTAEKLIPVIANKGHLHRLGVLIIDEVNHLVDVVGQSKNQVIAFLKNLNQAIGLPIVYIGTPEAVPVLAGNFQIARRSQGIQTIIMDRYEEDDKEWHRLVNSIWRNQVLKNSGQLTPDIRKAYYELSQGILDVLVKLHVQAQKRALSKGLEAIDRNLLEVVSKDHASLIQPMIDSIRSQNRHLMSQYRDISMENLRIARQLQTKDSKSDNSSSLSSLLEREFTVEEIRFCMSELLKKDPTMKPADLFSETQQVLGKINKQSRTSIRRKPEGKLIKDGKNDYAGAKDAGVVKGLTSLAIANLSAIK